MAISPVRHWYTGISIYRDEVFSPNKMLDLDGSDPAYSNPRYGDFDSIKKLDFRSRSEISEKIKNSIEFHNLVHALELTTAEVVKNKGLCPLGEGQWSSQLEKLSVLLDLSKKRISSDQAACFLGINREELDKKCERRMLFDPQKALIATFFAEHSHLEEQVRYFKVYLKCIGESSLSFVEDGKVIPFSMALGIWILNDLCMPEALR